MIVHHLFDIGIPVLEKVLRTVAVYGGVVLLLRMAGKRNLAQLNSFDLVVLLILSNVVQNAIIGHDESLTGGLLGAAILVATNAAVVRLVRRREFAVKLFEGSPTVLIRAGAIDQHALARVALRRVELLHAIRLHGAHRVEEVEKATLEPGGSIIVELRPEAEAATRADIARIETQLAGLRELLSGTAS